MQMTEFLDSTSESDEAYCRREQVGHFLACIPATALSEGSLRWRASKYTLREASDTCRKPPFCGADGRSGLSKVSICGERGKLEISKFRFHFRESVIILDVRRVIM